MNQQEMEDRWPKYVLMADVNRIKDYIFASVRLRHIVTASALLAYVNEVNTEELIRKYYGEVVFTSGGITQAIFDDREKAECCMRDIEMLYPKETHTATVAVHSEPWEEDEDFLDVIYRARRAVRQKKDAGVQDPGLESEPMAFFSGSPFFRICDQTGREFATVMKQPQDQGEEEEDQDEREAFGAGSWRQEEWKPSRSIKVKLRSGMCVGLDIELGDRLEVDTILRHQLAYGLGREPEELAIPFDFEHLVAGAQPANYLGFMDADGNGFGSALSKLADDGAAKEDYKEFSALLKETTRDAFIEAAVKVLEPYVEQDLRRNNIPLRVLILGGDDVLIVALPQIILPLANEFCRLFQEMADRRKLGSEREIVRKLDPLTMSAGVVIAHHKFPFLSFQRMGSSLLKSAKRRAWIARCKEQGDCFGSVDFQIITASGADDLKSLRRDAYVSHYRGEDEVSLTGRPYLVSPHCDELRRLRHMVAEMKKAGIPRRQVKALNHLLRNGKGNGSIQFLRWFSRLGEASGQRDIIKCLLNGEGMGVSPWIRDKRLGIEDEKRIYTPLLDAAELFDIPDELAESEIGREGST